MKIIEHEFPEMSAISDSKVWNLILQVVLWKSEKRTNHEPTNTKKV